MIEKIALISVLSSLLTEGVKKLLDEAGVKYSSNALASIFSVAMTLAIQIYAFAPKMAEIGSQDIADTFALMLLSFLGATVGYDKVMQMLKQIKE